MNCFGSVLEEFYIEKYRKNRETRQRKLAAIVTKSDAERYVAETRAKLRAIYHFPTEKCPLDPKITGVIDEPAFTIEKTVFYSLTDFPVTALCYKPRNLTAPAPGVLFLCGHSLIGKGADAYQMVARSLVLKGCVVLALDPSGQGERCQLDPGEGLFCVWEHNSFNRKLQALGHHFGEIRAYDAIRGVDYLLSLPEVDSTRVGVTGNSGGGTMTTIVNALEDRFTAAAPSCYITTWLRNIENELPIDAEQIPPGAARDGGEMADLLIAAAPRPLLILGQKNDFFDVRGTREAYDEVRKIYQLLGHENDVNWFIGPRSHGFSVENRTAVYRFFKRNINFTGDEIEPREAAPRPVDELLCAPEGCSVNIPNSKNLNDIINALLDDTVKRRPSLNEFELRAAIARQLGLTLPVAEPGYRQLRVTQPTQLLVASRFGVESEAHLPTTMYLMSRSEHFHIPAGEKAELYLPSRDSIAELTEKPLPLDRLCFALDYRGIGESFPAGCDKDPQPFSALYRGDYFMDSAALLLGESYFGGRVRDALAAISLLKSHGVKNITLKAEGDGKYVAIFAAFLADGEVNLDLETPPPTYVETIKATVSPLPQSFIPFGILELTDTDVLLKLLASKR